MPDADQLDRLAALAGQLGRRRRQLEEMRKLVDPLRQGGLEAVEGESSLLADLDTKLETAFQLLDSLSSASDKDDALSRLDGVLDDVNWELADDLHPDLEEKYQRQVRMVQQATIDLKEWENRLTEAARVIDGARIDGAPFSALEARLRAARSGVASVRSALTDRLYGGLPALRQSVQSQIGELEATLERTAPQVARVKKLIKQADLLIMRVGIKPDEYEYRVLLRSADRLQTRGVNIIQDVRPLSKQDRDWMLEQLDLLTGGLNRNLRAAHVARQASVAAVAGAGDPAGAAVAATPGGVPPAGAVRTISAADPMPGDAAGREPAQILQTLGEFMFRLVIPQEMQAYLKRERWSFSITTNDLELPWELVCFEPSEENESGEPEMRCLCLERSISRVPLGGIFPPAPPRRTGAMNRRRRMLLIHSDPEKTLSSAASEVDTIARELAGELDFERVDPDRATNSNLNRILMSQAFDFIHYAGHAYFDRENPMESGLQLKDSRLTARKVRLLSKGGSLVFLNACESGTVARENQPQEVTYLLHKPEPVVGLASAFVYSGALGCVGSLWPVYDRPAAELAVRFYRHVLEGEPTGEALRLARNEIRTEYRGEITWAGYVLYGDPTFRLTET